jgi:hypothetical protein
MLVEHQEDEEEGEPDGGGDDTADPGDGDASAA